MARSAAWVPSQKAFWEMVDVKDDGRCWEWLGSIYRHGYGQFASGTEWRYAHRTAYLFEVGEIPRGLCVLHMCDNRSCVNPGHLFLGTHQDNMDDMVSKGRQSHPVASGERNGRAILTRGQVEFIRSIVGQNSVLAGAYGVKPVTITKARNGSNWRG